MKQNFAIILVIVLFLTAVPSMSATIWDIGATRPQFARAVKAKKIKLKKAKVGKTVLVYDTKIPIKRVRAVKKWIRFLPPKVQRTARKVYFLSYRNYLLTGNSKEMSESLGYAFFEMREIFFYSTSDYDEMQDTLYHEFGHTYDNRKGRWHGYSDTKTWRRISGKDVNRSEYFAETFADYWTYLYTREIQFLRKALTT